MHSVTKDFLEKVRTSIEDEQRQLEDMFYVYEPKDLEDEKINRLISRFHAMLNLRKKFFHGYHLAYRACKLFDRAMEVSLTDPTLALGLAERASLLKKQSLEILKSYDFEWDELHACDR